MRCYPFRRDTTEAFRKRAAARGRRGEGVGTVVVPVAVAVLVEVEIAGAAESGGHVAKAVPSGGGGGETKLRSHQTERPQAGARGRSV